MKTTAKAIGLFLLGMVVDKDTESVISADPVRVLLIAATVSALFFHAPPSIAIALTASLTVTSSLALWQSGTSRQKPEE